LNPDAVRYLEATLQPEWRGIEWGCGRSTLWLAARTAELTSIESDGGWFRDVTNRALALGVTNLDLRLVEAQEGDVQQARAYVDAKPKLGPESVEYALVDGIFRDRCALRAVGLLRPGGLLVFDNANWWIPHDTDTPFSATYAVTPAAEQLMQLLAAWDLHWTSDGITDTAIWIKPGRSRPTLARDEAHAPRVPTLVRRRVRVPFGRRGGERR
jgi:hypothetical protein